MRSVLSFVFTVAALPVTFLGYGFLLLSGVLIVAGFVIVFFYFAMGVLIWLAGLASAGIGAALCFGVEHIAGRIGYGRHLYRRRR